MEIREAIKIIEKERDHCASHNRDFGKSAEYHKEMQDMVDAFDVAIKVLKREADWEEDNESYHSVGGTGNGNA